jgi:hypothetical protein
MLRVMPDGQRGSLGPVVPVVLVAPPVLDELPPELGGPPLDVRLPPDPALAVEEGTELAIVPPLAVFPPVIEPAEAPPEALRPPSAVPPLAVLDLPATPPVLEGWREPPDD